MRLIDADALKEYLEECRYHSFNLDDAIHAVDNAPEVERTQDKRSFSQPVAYKELAVGDFFFCSRCGGYYGIKLSERRFFDLDRKHVYGFYNNQANDSDSKNYLKVSYERLGL